MACDFRELLLKAIPLQLAPQRFGGGEGPAARMRIATKLGTKELRSESCIQRLFVPQLVGACVRVRDAAVR